MGLDLDGRATGAFDEGLHRLYVLTNAMCRGLPMHIRENFVSVVAGEDTLPVRLVPAREVELVHSLEIALYHFVDHDGCLLSGRFLAQHSGSLGFSVLAKELERERTGRRSRFGTGRMSHDGVRDRAVSRGSRVGVEHLPSQWVRDCVGDSACVDEDSFVRQRSQQAAPVSDTDGRVEGDRLPHSVDVRFCDPVTPKDSCSQAKGEAPSRPHLGIGIAPSRVAKGLRRAVGLPEAEGVLVRAVEDDSLASKAGLQEGDLIVAASGQEVKSVDDLFDALDRLGTEGTLELKVLRGTEERTVPVRPS
jgi:PDZ domain